MVPLRYGNLGHQRGGGLILLDLETAGCAVFHSWLRACAPSGARVSPGNVRVPRSCEAKTGHAGLRVQPKMGGMRPRHDFVAHDIHVAEWRRVKPVRGLMSLRVWPGEASLEPGVIVQIDVPVVVHVEVTACSDVD